jgi:nitric oxide reductase NorQ protein
MATGSQKLCRRIDAEPYYLGTGEEIALFEAAYAARLPVLLKGPTGCGKTRFVEHMAWRLCRPLITVACHEDLFASDLIGRYLLKDDETVWVDGPLTAAVRQGAICYLDEVVEARKDTTVVIHPLTDDRRMLSIDKKGELLKAHPDFLYPDPDREAEIVAREGGIDPDGAARLVALAVKIRGIREHGLAEGASTRLLIYAARLMTGGIPAQEACRAALCEPLTDDARLADTISELIEDLF